MTDSTNFKTLVDVVIKAECAGTPRNELILDLGPTPQHLLDCGFNQHTIVVKAATIGKMFFDHGITQGVIERLPSIIQTPDQIFTSSTTSGSAVIFTYEVKGSSPIIIAIHKDKTIGRQSVNLIASMYAKTGPYPRPRWIRDGLLLWDSAQGGVDAP